MNKAKKIIFYFLICFFFPITLFSCSTSSVEVKLYDNDVFLRSVNVDIGEEYSFGTASKPGYDFTGWYSDAENGTAYTDAKGDSAGLVWHKDNSTILYAHWENRDYEILFDYCDADDGDEITSIPVTYDLEIDIEFPIPSKTNYSFDGWFTKKDGGNRITDSLGNIVEEAKIFKEPTYEIDNDASTLYAHWVQKTISFVFVTDGSKVETVSYHSGDTIINLPTSIKDNYCFDGWYFDETLLDPIEYPYLVEDTGKQSIILYAKFSYGSINSLSFESINNDREYSVSYFGEEEDIVVPDSYFGKKVTEINAIQSETLKRILIPQTIAKIKPEAFMDCINLEEVNIPLLLTDIPSRCFYGCSNIKNIDIPEMVSSIGESAFDGCVSMEYIHIPAKVNSIGSGAFQNMSILKEIDVSKDNTKYYSSEGVLYYKLASSSYLVQYPAGKTENYYEIDASTVKLMDYSFSGSSIEKVIIGGKISTIGKGCFEGCNKLISVTIETNANNLSIDDNAFANCHNLKTLLIYLSNIPLLGSNVFENVSDNFSVYVNSQMIKKYESADGWDSLSECIYSIGNIYGNFAVEEKGDGYYIKQYFGNEESVEIPEIINAKKIIGISSSAFSFSKMSEVVIPSNVLNIEDYAFSNCVNLVKCVVKGLPASLGNAVFENVNDDFAVYVDNDLEVLTMYKNNNQWNVYPIWSY